jgi:hypothetical protein
VTQVFHFRSAKSAFGTFEEQLVIPEVVGGIYQHAPHVLPSFSINQNIIKEYKHKIAQEGPKNLFMRLKRWMGHCKDQKASPKTHNVLHVCGRSS